MKETFKLTEHERLNPVWPKLMKYFEARLQSLRERNDANSDPQVTAMLRGRIAELKAVMNLDKEMPFIE